MKSRPSCPFTTVVIYFLFRLNALALFSHQIFYFDYKTQKMILMKNNFNYSSKDDTKATMLLVTRVKTLKCPFLCVYLLWFLGVNL